MDDPQYCSICNQPLHRMKHPVAHAGHYNCDAEIRTCPHNVFRTEHYSDPRHDEWHRCDDSWMKREA